MMPSTFHATAAVPIGPTAASSLRRRLTVLAVLGLVLTGLLGVIGADRADARLCYSGGYCPAVMATTTYFRMSNTHVGGCMTWRTDTAADSQTPWTEGTVQYRSCYTQHGEPAGNVIGVFTPAQDASIDWSMFGSWPGPPW